MLSNFRCTSHMLSALLCQLSAAFLCVIDASDLDPAALAQDLSRQCLSRPVSKQAVMSCESKQCWLHGLGFSSKVL